jgi:hypothetical protein
VKFLVNSAILRSCKNLQTFAEGATKMLSKEKIKNFELKSCYFRGPENRWLSSFN